MNQITLVGRLTRDPEPGQASNGNAFCRFGLAVDRPYSKNGEKKVDFFNVVVWNKPAENAAKFLSKGRQVALIGSMQQKTDKDGKAIPNYEVVATYVEYLGGQSNNNHDNQYNQGGQNGGRANNNQNAGGYHNNQQQQQGRPMYDSQFKPQNNQQNNGNGGYPNNGDDSYYSRNNNRFNDQQFGGNDFDPVPWDENDLPF